VIPGMLQKRPEDTGGQLVQEWQPGLVLERKPPVGGGNEEGCPDPT
jgi:hypothetical protein